MELLSTPQPVLGLVQGLLEKPDPLLGQEEGLIQPPQQAAQAPHSPTLVRLSPHPRSPQTGGLWLVQACWRTGH